MTKVQIRGFDGTGTYEIAVTFKLVLTYGHLTAAGINVPPVATLI